MDKYEDNYQTNTSKIGKEWDIEMGRLRMKSGGGWQVGTYFQVEKVYIGYMAGLSSSRVQAQKFEAQELKS